MDVYKGKMKPLSVPKSVSAVNSDMFFYILPVTVQNQANKNLNPCSSF